MWLALLLLFSPTASAIVSANFLDGDLFEFGVGPGFQAGTNFRIRNDLRNQQSDQYSGIVPLYNLRVGPISITNTYEVQDFTKGKSLRAGVLLTVRGHPYRATTIEERKESLFAGGYIGYKALTLYTHADVMSRSSGMITTFAFTPKLYESKSSALYLIFSAEHMNHAYVSYYFGVRPNEVALHFPQYDGEEANNFSARFAYKNQFSKYAAWLLWAGEKFYGKGVTDSPTVGKRFEFSCGAGVLVGLF
jgi:hypothetical protein